MIQKNSSLNIETAARDYPFLCAKCRPYGRCINSSSQSKGTEARVYPNPVLENIKKDNSPVTERQISNWVNVRTGFKEATSVLGKKLQQAHDLFHQNEYEQASYLYLAIFQTRNDCEEAWKGICASNYFLGRYEEAVCVSSYFPRSQIDNFVDRFDRLCELKVKERNAVFPPVQMEPENPRVLFHDTTLI